MWREALAGEAGRGTENMDVKICLWRWFVLGWRGVGTGVGGRFALKIY